MRESSEFGLVLCACLAGGVLDSLLILFGEFGVGKAGRRLNLSGGLLFLNLLHHDLLVWVKLSRCDGQWARSRDHAGRRLGNLLFRRGKSLSSSLRNEWPGHCSGSRSVCSLTSKSTQRLAAGLCVLKGRSPLLLDTPAIKLGVANAVDEEVVLIFGSSMGEDFLDEQSLVLCLLQALASKSLAQLLFIFGSLLLFLSLQVAVHLVPTVLVLWLDHLLLPVRDVSGNECAPELFVGLGDLRTVDLDISELLRVLDGLENWACEFVWHISKVVDLRREANCSLGSHLEECCCRHDGQRAEASI